MTLARGLAVGAPRSREVAVLLREAAEIELCDRIAIGGGGFESGARRAKVARFKRSLRLSQYGVGVAGDGGACDPCAGLAPSRFRFGAKALKREAKIELRGGIAGASLRRVMGRRVDEAVGCRRLGERRRSGDGDQSPKSRSNRPPKLSSFADAGLGGKGVASGGSGPPSINRCSWPGMGEVEQSGRPSVR